MLMAVVDASSLVNVHRPGRRPVAGGVLCCRMPMHLSGRQLFRNTRLDYLIAVGHSLQWDLSYEADKHVHGKRVFLDRLSHSTDLRVSTNRLITSLLTKLD